MFIHKGKEDFGIDIGAHSIKVCEISGNPEKFKVDKFGAFTLSEAATIEDETQKPDEISEGLADAMKNAGIKSKAGCLGLYGPNTMTKRLNVPEGTKEEIEDHIMWEAEQYITFGADESQIAFHIIGDKEGGGKDALVAAARVDLIESFAEVLASVKVTAKIVDLNILAISNVFEEAEDLKTTSDDMGNLPEEILNIINTQIDQQLAEVKKNTNFYITQGRAEKVNYCFITGGNSLSPGLLEN